MEPTQPDPADDYAETQSEVKRLLEEGKAADFSRLDDPGAVGSIAETAWQYRTVAGSFIRGLLMDKGLRNANEILSIQGLRVVGDIDLEGFEINVILSMTRCLINGRIVMVDATARRIGLHQSLITGDILAASMTTTGSLAITESELIGRIDLRLGEMGGQLDLRGSTLTAFGSTAIDARSARIKGSVRLDNCIITGRVDLNGITIDGVLQCEGSEITGSDHPGFQTPQSLVAGKSSAWPDASSRLFYPVRRIERRESLNCDYAKIAGPVYLGSQHWEAVSGQPRFTAVGGVRFFGAVIGGNLTCEGANISNDTQIALDLEHATIGGSLLIRDGTRIEGTLRLFAASIHDSVEVNHDVSISNPASIAISAERIDVAGPVFLRESVSFDGMVTFARATVGGAFDCYDGSFKQVAPSIEVVPGSAPLPALCLDGAVIGSDLLLSRDFAATGRVSLLGLRAAGNVNCWKGAFSNARGPALEIADSVIGGRLILAGARFDGVVNLARTSAGVLVDSKESWPVRTVERRAKNTEQTVADSAGSARLVSGLVLNGFRYKAIDSVDMGWRLRRDWIRRQFNVRAPQPYLELAAMYRSEGLEGDARKIQISRHNAQLRWWTLWRWVLRWTIGYGYQPLRALAVAIAIVLIGGVVFGRAADENAFAPTRQTAAVSSVCDPTVYPCLNPWVYSIETLLPVIRLGQRDYWTPNTDQARGVAGFAWLESLIGWVLGLLVVAGFTNVVRRE